MQNLKIIILNLIFLVHFGGNAWALTETDSLFDFFCQPLSSASGKAIAYENQKLAFIDNIHLIKTFEKFAACQTKDPSLKVDPKYNSELLAIHIFLASKNDNTVRKSDQLTQKVLTIFSLAKKIYLQKLEQLSKATAGTAKSFFDSLSRRISTVRLVKSTACGDYNAGYDANHHTIHICKEIMHYPEATLMAIISHELSHAIDPCMTQFTLSMVSGHNPFYKVNSLLFQSEINSAYTTIPFEWAEMDFDVTRDQFSSVSSSLSYHENPFHSALKCLQDRGSVHASTRSGPLNSELIVDAEGMCSKTSGSEANGEMQEAFADWMAFEIFADYLETLKLSSQKAALFEGVLNITANECNTLDSDLEREMKTALKKSSVCSKDIEKIFPHIEALRNQTLKSMHPNGNRRVDKLYFAQPKIREMIVRHYQTKILENDRIKVLHCKP